MHCRDLAPVYNSTDSFEKSLRISRRNFSLIFSAPFSTALSWFPMFSIFLPDFYSDALYFRNDS
jgi:hypothetical protein